MISRVVPQLRASSGRKNSPLQSCSGKLQTACWKVKLGEKIKRRRRFLSLDATNGSCSTLSHRTALHYHRRRARKERCRSLFALADVTLSRSSGKASLAELADDTYGPAGSRVEVKERCKLCGARGLALPLEFKCLQALVEPGNIKEGFKPSVVVVCKLPASRSVEMA